MAADVPPDLAEVAWDPQTSGGLLVALPAYDAPRLVEALAAAAVTAVVVGAVEPGAAGPCLLLRG